jgi:hypothetical protein
MHYTLVLETDASCAGSFGGFFSPRMYLAFPRFAAFVGNTQSLFLLFTISESSLANPKKASLWYRVKHSAPAFAPLLEKSVVRRHTIHTSSRRPHRTHDTLWAA